ncbi:MAG: TIGR03560 family F420-dependent LLM class oxidoreductase [Myxococcota bacterium]
MAIKLGVHTGPQDLSMEELQRIWRTADDAGFHWISVWDHFYANPLQSRENPCFEGVASMAALAALTKNVQVGCLVFCSSFRPPGVLAKAATTIDHLSGGRANIGLGAGWFEEEWREFGYGFPPLRERMDHLEESIQVLRSLLHEDSTTFKGEYLQYDGAVCSPRPVNPRLPIWIGGRGERRTPTLAARFADGFNVPYAPPELFADRVARLDRFCEEFGRDPAEIERSVNVGFYMSASVSQASEQERSGFMARMGGAGMLVGTPAQAIDRIGEYERAGAQGLNIAFRPPVDWEAFQAFIEEVLPVFHES